MVLRQAKGNVDIRGGSLVTYAGPVRQVCTVVFYELHEKTQMSVQLLS